MCFTKIKLCAYVAGRGGEGLKRITKSTGAKVSCSKERVHNPGAMGKVIITGTRQEVKQAKVSRNHTFGDKYSYSHITENR